MTQPAPNDTPASALLRNAPCECGDGYATCRVIDGECTQCGRVEPAASPLCRVPGSPSVWMRHDMASNGVCARCGWALPGRAVRQEEEQR